ncbi:MAG: A/G-specific adenine glycosylase [Minisyncoccia bacterium]|jgi:A/G-specific adenine glycosylase
MTIRAFKKTIWAHYHRAGRTNLPWRHTRDPYAIFVSEIMLQQTQAARVEKYYEKFIKRFPSFRALARAKTSDVLSAWQGLGYNRRAMFLKRSAEIVVARHAGRLPRERAVLEQLPGVGKGTSGSLMAFAFNKPEIFIETNIRRVFIYFFFLKRRNVTDVELTRYIERSVDRKNPREWYWALMDYGAAMNVAGAAMPAVAMPRANPNRRSAHYKKQLPFTGSDRELRGKIVRSTLSQKRNRMSAKELLKELAVPRERFIDIIKDLTKEGFIVRIGDYICIKK